MFESRWHGTHHAVFVDLPASLINDIAHERLKGDPDRLEIPPQLNFSDEILFTLSNGLSWGVHEQTVIDVQYAQSITRTLALHLLLNYGNLPPLPVPKVGCFSQRQQRLIIEYIQVHLAEKRLHQQLAALICVSEGHFDKLFSTTFHMPTYRYIMKTRIDRAKHLLLTTELSLTDIAFECGFASQAHMTRCFTKAVGVSPGQFRRR
jgi:AraC family transcriptional regulator